MEDKTVFAQHKKTLRDGSIECFMWEKQEFTDAIRKDVIAWCYLDDLMALETELERTRKALDVAKDALKHYCTDSDNWSCVIDFTGDYNNTPSEFADKALEQITAEQKEHIADASKKIEQKE